LPCAFAAGVCSYMFFQFVSSPFSIPPPDPLERHVGGFYAAFHCVIGLFSGEWLRCQVPQPVIRIITTMCKLFIIELVSIFRNCYGWIVLFIQATNFDMFLDIPLVFTNILFVEAGTFFAGLTSHVRSFGHPCVMCMFS